ETLARPWAIPGTKGLEHRIGGLTKAVDTGNVVYDAVNHGRMVALRNEKIARIAQDVPPVEVDGPQNAELLVVGWGGTQGALRASVDEARERGHAVAYVHLRHLNPFPANLGEVLGAYDRILVPELNQGQLAMLLRAEYLVPARSYTKVCGQPFKVAELLSAIERALRGEAVQ
ncbi:MAG: 2-oxoglutarate ferredoxin oxidoreductase subunit alpha, partial [Gemmatimonadetes bacterium]